MHFLVRVEGESVGKKHQIQQKVLAKAPWKVIKWSSKWDFELGILIFNCELIKGWLKNLFIVFPSFFVLWVLFIIYVFLYLKWHWLWVSLSFRAISIIERGHLHDHFNFQIWVFGYSPIHVENNTNLCSYEKQSRA